MGSHLDSNSLANFHAFIFVSSDQKKKKTPECQNTRGGLLPIDVWLRLGFIANIFFSYSYLSFWQAVISNYSNT